MFLSQGNSAFHWAEFLYIFSKITVLNCCIFVPAPITLLCSQFPVLRVDNTPHLFSNCAGVLPLLNCESVFDIFYLVISLWAVGT